MVSQSRSQLHGAQQFCTKVKPNNIIDLSAITSIFRPGPLSAGVDADYVEAKESPHYIKYLSEEAREITEETFGFLIFQEQIALLAHKLGGLTLDEGNMLRKVLTKKGTGKNSYKAKLHEKFIKGCVAKKINRDEAQSLWDKLSSSLVTVLTSRMLYHTLSFPINALGCGTTTHRS